jgi:pyrroloquinoline quinone biosynthesis protein B
MWIRVLGSAAGGGFPQWNCNCRGCAAARDPAAPAKPRTQSSIAVRARKTDRWFLVNASPDLRQQLPQLGQTHNGALRGTPLAGIVLSDAEIDHTAGLLLLRESGEPLDIWSIRSVRAALTTDFPVLTMLERYCGVRWHELPEGEPVPLGEALVVEAFATGGDPPVYVGDATAAMTASGISIRDRETDNVLVYAPALEEIDDAIRERLERADCVIVDGTFWMRDELVSLGLGDRDAVEMGHQPLWGDGGSLATLERLPARTILAHINNTNPILVEDSPERALVDARGIDVAYDGMEIEL